MVSRERNACCLVLKVDGECRETKRVIRCSFQRLKGKTSRLHHHAWQWRSFGSVSTADDDSGADESDQVRTTGLSFELARRFTIGWTTVELGASLKPKHQILREYLLRHTEAAYLDSQATVWDARADAGASCRAVRRPMTQWRGYCCYQPRRGVQ